MSFIGRNSKAPFFSCENLALTNGAFGAYDADSYASAHEVGRTAARCAAWQISLGSGNH